MEKCRCTETGRIATLEANNKTLFKKLDDMSDLKKSVSNLDKNFAVNTHLLNSMVEHDKKQDTINEQMSMTLDNINTNLHELNTGQKQLNERVATVEERVDKNEALHSVDLRHLKKKHYKEVISRYILPTGGFAALIMWFLEYFLK